MPTDAHAAYRHSTSSHRGVICTQDDCPLSLEGTNINVETFWSYARVTIQQEYLSLYPRSVSAFAAFNAKPEWELISFRCDVNDQSFYTKIDRMKIEAVKTTHVEAPIDMYTVNIPIPFHTGHTAVITTIFLCPLQFISVNELEFHLPKMMLASKAKEESTDWKTSFNVVNSGRRFPPKIQFKSKGLLFNAVEGKPEVFSKDPEFVKAAKCSILANPKHFEVSYDSPEGEQNFNEDISFRVKCIPDEDPITVQLLREEAENVAPEDKFACAVSLTPNFDSFNNSPNIELVVALDASASMAPYVKDVQAALFSMAKGLPSSCFFNCVTFGGSCQWLFPKGSEQNSTAVLEQWTQFLKGYDAVADQTRIYTAVQEIYGKPAIRGYARVVLLISDGGEPKLPAKTVEICSHNTHTTRLVSVGLGPSHDANLLKLLAKASHGLYAPATGFGDITAAMVSSLEQVLVPTMVEVSLKFTYDGIEEVPPLRNCSDRFAVIPASTRTFFYAFGSDTLRGCTATVFGNVAGQHLEYKIHTGELDNNTVDKTLATPGNASTVSIAHAAAAAQRIFSLVNENLKSCLSKDQENEVIRLSTAFCVPSPYTTYKLCAKTGEVLDEEGRNVIAPYVMQHARFITPVMPAVRDGTGALVDADKYVLASRSKKNTEESATSPKKKQNANTTAGFMKNVVTAVVDDICNPTSVAQLLQAQQLDGSWLPCHHVVCALGKTTEDFLALKPINVSDAVWTTAGVKWVLNTPRFSGQETETKLALKKAQVFLDGNADTATTAEEAVAQNFKQ